jgi:tetratricopeptide (TPR) repeat protein
LSKKDEALTDSATALKADPSWMDLRLMRANIFVSRGNNELVAREAELLTSENSTSSYAYVAAGKIYARLARTQDAMKAFERALAIKPEAYVYLNRAQARPFTDHAGRMADIESALKLEPNNEDVLAEKAEQLAVEGNVKAAKDIYDRVIGTDPESRYYKARRAVFLYKAGAVEESKKAFAELRSQAKTASDLNSLCWAKATGGILLDAALEECHAALQRDPGSGAYLDSLALVELRLGHVDQAIADYTQAIAKSTGAASYMGRALAYSQKGDEASAKSDRRQALQLDPDEETRFAEFGLPFGKSSGGAAK